MRPTIKVPSYSWDIRALWIMYIGNLSRGRGLHHLTVHRRNSGRSGSRHLSVFRHLPRLLSLSPSPRESWGILPNDVISYISSTHLFSGALRLLLVRRRPWGSPSAVDSLHCSASLGRDIMSFGYICANVCGGARDSALYSRRHCLCKELHLWMSLFCRCCRREWVQPNLPQFLGND